MIRGATGKRSSHSEAKSYLPLGPSKALCLQLLLLEGFHVYYHTGVLRGLLLDVVKELFHRGVLCGRPAATTDTNIRVGSRRNEMSWLICWGPR